MAPGNGRTSENDGIQTAKKAISQPLLEMCVHFRRQSPSYNKAEANLSGSILGVQTPLVPSKKTRKAMTFE